MCSQFSLRHSCQNCELTPASSTSPVCRRDMCLCVRLGLSSARPREIAARIIKKQPVLTAETVVADAFGLGDLVPFKGDGTRAL